MTSAAGVGGTTTPSYDVMATMPSSHWWVMIENVLVPTTSREKIPGERRCTPPFLYINKDGCGSRWTYSTSIDIRSIYLTYVVYTSPFIGEPEPWSSTRKKAIKGTPKHPIVTGDSIFPRVLAQQYYPPFFPSREGEKKSRGAVSSHIGSTHCYRLRWWNLCNKQNEQFPSYWTRSFEGPDRLNQVLSAHLAQVDRVSLL